MLMLYGGSLFGVIDHLWNGELLLISQNWPKDLALGVVITGAILFAWAIVLYLAKKGSSFNTYLVNPQGK